MEPNTNQKSVTQNRIHPKPPIGFSYQGIPYQNDVLCQKDNPLTQQCYFFPTYLRVQIKGINQINAQTRQATADIVIFLSVYHGQFDSEFKEFITELQKKMFIQTPFNEPIKPFRDSEEKKEPQDSLQRPGDNSEKYIPRMYFKNDSKNKTLHWKARVKQFKMKIKTHVFFHPFESANLISEIKIAPVQFEWLMNGETKKIIAVFNLMDLAQKQQRHIKIIQGQKIYAVRGLSISPSLLKLRIHKNKEQMNLFHEKVISKNKESKKRSRKLGNSLLFVKEECKQLRNAKDYFSTAFVDLHMHMGLRVAFANFVSNFLCFFMLAVLSFFVHFQKVSAIQIIGSAATIAIAFGTSIISIRSQIIFKPGQTMFEIIYCLQMLILVIPLFDYWNKYKLQTFNMSVITETTGTTTTVTNFQQTVVQYLDSILKAMQGSPLVETYWRDKSFIFSLVMTFILCIIITIMLIMKMWMFWGYRERDSQTRQKDYEQFLRFDRRKWRNEQCRQFFSSQEHTIVQYYHELQNI